MVLALFLLVTLLWIPALLGLVALAAALVRPNDWDIIATIVSAPPILAFVAMLAVSLWIPDNSGDTGPITAVRAIFFMPFLLWYLGWTCGGAFGGHWLATRSRRRVER
ncbi:MAG: hypothetical protein Q8S13_03840 [Dehalococcoidia bacterium]|nr:hypothetical protein [Dehalococcoidia bacterium]